MHRRFFSYTDVTSLRDAIFTQIDFKDEPSVYFSKRSKLLLLCLACNCDSHRYVWNSQKYFMRSLRKPAEKTERKIQNGHHHGLRNGSNRPIAPPMGGLQLRPTHWRIALTKEGNLAPRSLPSIQYKRSHTRAERALIERHRGGIVTVKLEEAEPTLQGPVQGIGTYFLILIAELV